MSIQPCSPEDIFEFDDGERMYRHEFESLAARDPGLGMERHHTVIPVGHASYEATARHMNGRRTGSPH